jgi:hypothetical protein
MRLDYLRTIRFIRATMLSSAVVASHPRLFQRRESLRWAFRIVRGPLFPHAVWDLPDGIIIDVYFRMKYDYKTLRNLPRSAWHRNCGFRRESTILNFADSVAAAGSPGMGGWGSSAWLRKRIIEWTSSELVWSTSSPLSAPMLMRFVHMYQGIDCIHLT